MKNYILLILFTFILVGCTIKQRENRMVWYYNYSKPDTIAFETDRPFLTDDQFNRTVLDTAKLFLLDENINIQLQKAIYRLYYEIGVRDQYDESWKKYYVNRDPKKDNFYFFLFGKLNLQAGVNSLIILESDRSFGDEISGLKLWLFNTKNNHLCSIILLGDLFNINVSPCPLICVKNKIFTKTKFEERHFLRSNFGDQFRLKDKKYFSTFKIDENGFLEFTKN